MIWPALSFIVKYRRYAYIIAIIAAVVSFFIWLHFHDQKNIKACEARLQAEIAQEEIKVRDNLDKQRAEYEKNGRELRGLSDADLDKRYSRWVR